MLNGIEVLFPTLLITWGTLAIGIIPVLLAWSRITSQWHGTGQRVIPKALIALTASICIGRVGSNICQALTDRFAIDSYPILFGLLVFGFLLNLAALVLALRERNAARNAVLTGSFTVAVINVTGFIWLFVATNGSPL